MESVERSDPLIKRLLAAKEKRRHKLAKLSFPEKVQAIVRLQKAVYPILFSRGKKIHVWDIRE
jgi:hypothetical protein